MSKIILNQSSIVINNYQLGDCPILENTFSKYDRTTHKYFLKGVLYDEENKRFILPRGIDVSFVEELIGEQALINRQYDEYDKYYTMMMKYKPRDEIQVEALRFMIGIGKYEYTKRCSQLSVNLNTGAGKTYCTVATIAHSGIRSAIITTSTNWLQQWKKCILDYTDTRPNEIFMIIGTPSIFSLLKKDISKYKFILISHNTIKSYGDTYGWEYVTELFKYMRIGYKVYDEAHLNFDNMCMIDYYTNTYKTFYVTATPARSDDDENKIFQYYFRNIPSVNLFNENTDTHTKYVSIRYNSRPSHQAIDECRNQYGLDRNKYVNYIVSNENFYKILTIILNMSIKVEGKVLIFVGTNYGISIIKEWIEENYGYLIGEVGVYTSLTPPDIKKEQLNRKIILSTTKSCGTAVDIKYLKMTVVLAEPFKSEVLARQTLGRTRDNNTFYIEVVDSGFAQIPKYYYAKKHIFEKYAESVSDISLTDKKLDEKYNEILKTMPIRDKSRENLFVKIDRDID